jgi:rubrerythrin
MDIKGSKTETNLMAAFAGESQARNRYTYFSSKAKKEGYVQIANIFEETANQEKEHAKRFFKFMTGDTTEITAAFPFGVIGTTHENLLAAAEGENFEWTTLYPGFAAVACDEGFNDVADAFTAIVVAERQHEKRYLDLARNVKEDKVFKRDGKVVWRCINCGYLHEGTEALDLCPACLHPLAHFEILGENW